jgi:hypothetical protein
MNEGIEPASLIYSEPVPTIIKAVFSNFDLTIFPTIFSVMKKDD